MSFASNSIQMLTWRAAILILGSVISIVLARFLGPDLRGSLAIVMLSSGIAAALLDSGTAVASIQLIGSEAFAMTEIASTVFFYFLSLSALLAVPSYLVLARVSDLTPAQNVLVIAITGVTVLMTSLRHLLLGGKRFNTYSQSVVLEDIVLLAGIFAAWLMGRISLFSVLSAYLLSRLAALLTLLVHSVGFRTACSLAAIQPPIIVRAYQQGIHLFAAQMGSFGAQRINYFLLNHFTGSRAVGLFTAANTIPTMFANLPQQMSTVLYTHVSASKDMSHSARLTLSVVKIVILASLACLVPIAVFSKSIVATLFGAQFAGIERVLIILTISMIPFALSGVIFNTLAGSALQKYGSPMATINLVAITVLSYIFIPKMGAEGAAWANLIASLCSLAFVAAIFAAKFSVKPRDLFSFSIGEIRALATKPVRILSLYEP